MSEVEFPPIPVEEAVRLTTNWRVFFANLIKEEDPNSPKVFRGFTIPIQDLEQILDHYDDYPNMTGIRVYIAKDCEQRNGGLVHLVVVPVDESGKDVTTLKDGKSSVYDFTSPCPEVCDTSSKLYSSTVTEIKC